MKTTLEPSERPARRACSVNDLAKPVNFCYANRSARFRKLLESAYLARAGAASMTLSDWREVEQEIKHKLEHEHD